MKRVSVVVLGDVGRSPRMQNHALSFAKAGFHVDLVGFGGSRLIKDLDGHHNVSLFLLGDFPSKLSKLPRMLYYLVKASYQFLQLFMVLFSCAIHSSHVVVQNPPAIPTLAVAWVACVICNAKLVIDWHNYGYTILSLALDNPDHLLVKIAKWYEHGFGKMSTLNLCVTEAMREDLLYNWQIRANTLYDRPPERFKSAELETRHQLFIKLSNEYPEVFGQKDRLSEFAIKVVEEITAFTVRNSLGKVIERDDRPALLVSSTSWTEDEDFSVLLDALEDYEKHATDSNSNLPRLVCAITGKGPLKEYYQNLIAGKQFKFVSVCTPWLEPEDYPRLLGSANLGVCLHKSSSGLDLPMKVVDMFGCGLPVCAIDFKCISELVHHNENGLIFKDSKELSKQMKELLTGFPKSQTKLQAFRDNLKGFQELRWDESWNNVVLPLLGR
ncbi:chitobiosyldiphosphodolichol beta-mannosyltransferase [Exaiptasia diaphana]|uniref:Chitobiosyldiphosphodolichol beta-mannosyltransferase n=1 Tax=Exaiptasia diaphana TaxID=2652724 RepID=A0A913XCK2_EXADI|nr:chitobiosyldiphosphodolichol beta-mannosyltransferase [Exaiptasia diaphana]